MFLKYVLQMSERDYLADEKVNVGKREYIDGQVYARAGASRNHAIITSNLLRNIGNHLEAMPYITFTGDLKVKADGCFFYPDLVIIPEQDTGDEYYTEAPVLIAEVLSKQTRRSDKTTKMEAYKRIPHLLEYVLIEQDCADIEVCRRANNWRSEHFFLGDFVELESIDLFLPVETIYQRVNNEDIHSFTSDPELQFE